MELQRFRKFGEVRVKYLVRLVKNNVSALTGSNSSENKNVFYIVEQRIVCYRIAEIYADGLVNLRRSLVALRMEFLNDFEFFRRGQRRVKFDTCRGSEFDNSVLREVFNAAAVIARPFVNHSVFTIVCGNERKFVEPACDIAVKVNISASFACAHRYAENAVVVKVHRTRKSGNITVVCYNYGNIANFFCNVDVHILDFLIKVLFRNFEKEGSHHYAVVNVYSRRTYADCVNSRHMGCCGLHCVKNALIVIVRVGICLREPNHLFRINGFAVYYRADFSV